MNQVAEIVHERHNNENDYVTSRILWLDGLEEGHNKGGNVDSFKRYIYIHGTHEEGLIGEKASHGCIRMFNNDVIELFSYIPEETEVNIKI
jgi:lipoprotein-anchoring transpeptidase ErfK/SrfK